MFESLKLIVHQVIETLSEGSTRDIFHARIFWNRLATPVVMDLSTTNIQLTGNLPNTDYQFTEITMEDLHAGIWLFATPSRGLKALRNLKRGWRGFGSIEDSIIVGDLWCVTPHEKGSHVSHPDLKMLGIMSEEKDVYAFDMFIAPAYRGRNLAVPLQRSLQATLKMEGWGKVYGYYWDDNIPALWMHRMLKFKELPKRYISRFFFIVRSKRSG